MSNVDAHEAWNTDSGLRWARESDRRDRVLAPVADALLTAAQLNASEHVLDIGCGCGATTLTAARSVAPDGTATGIDLSTPMLDVARRRRDAGGVTNVTFITGDAQTHTFTDPYDVAISRFGTMFFADQVAAFANIASGLRSGGRLCLATWQRLASNNWLTVPRAALRRYGTASAVDHNAPGMFGQSDPETVTDVLVDTGFVDIDLHAVNLVLTFGSDLDDGTDYLANIRIVRDVLETVADDARPAAMNAIRAALGEHTDATGVHLGAAIWIVTAARR
jgi:ubiquinone/menaquinone biosynthesis C-methylase UbiE